MPGVLFLPDLFYDHRIWADLPASLADRIPPEAAADVPLEDLLAAAAPWAGIIDATAETDAARRIELVTRTWRDAYAGRLAASMSSLPAR